MSSVMYLVQVASIQHFYYKAVSLGQFLGAGKTSGMHIPRMGLVRVGKFQLPGSDLWSSLFEGLLQLWSTTYLNLALLKPNPYK